MQWGGAADQPVPVDRSVLERARQQIRPTRAGGPATQDETVPEDDPDAIADRNDADLTEDTQSHTELLQRHLGAEIIAEETEH
ncbi:MAG TPA: hypothetical protein VK020_13630 [Microlunatus sp.]|nr:hypothetical protein [Microlunatus sp.]